mmetsp:Transcript_49324/g.157801  ORF Transcript_49324/g.157801 Transcript_49324/m.157801 type:complete len:400 (-) Transcript_49324:80-1279(-)
MTWHLPDCDSHASALDQRTLRPASLALGRPDASLQMACCRGRVLGCQEAAHAVPKNNAAADPAAPAAALVAAPAGARAAVDAATPHAAPAAPAAPLAAAGCRRPAALHSQRAAVIGGLGVEPRCGSRRRRALVHRTCPSPTVLRTRCRGWQRRQGEGRLGPQLQPCVLLPQRDPSLVDLALVVAGQVLLVRAREQTASADFARPQCLRLPALLPHVLCVPPFGNLLQSQLVAAPGRCICSRQRFFCLAHLPVTPQVLRRLHVLLHLQAQQQELCLPRGALRGALVVRGRLGSQLHVAPPLDEEVALRDQHPEVPPRPLLVDVGHVLVAAELPSRTVAPPQLLVVAAAAGAEALLAVEEDFVRAEAAQVPLADVGPGVPSPQAAAAAAVAAAAAAARAAA